MRMLTFAKRCTKEILRDPINLAFGLGFPLVLLVLLSAMQANIPVSLFEINTLTPGITVFGLAFMTLFSATLISKDRESAFLQRLYTTPLTGLDFILPDRHLLPVRHPAGTHRPHPHPVRHHRHDPPGDFQYCAGSFVRQPSGGKTGWRHLRCIADQSLRMAVRCVV